MSQDGGTSLPVACNMDVLTPAERAHHAAVFEQLGKFMLSSSPLPDGRRFAIRPEAASLALLAEFIEGERRCCPFFAFTVRLEPGSAALWLDLTGPEGTREFIEEELGGAFETRKGEKTKR